MGLADSKPARLTTEERQQREQTKATLVNQRKEEIDRVQQDVIESVRSSSSTAIINAKDVVAVLKVTETAKTQLDRGGNALTKADLVAIIVALQPAMQANIARLESLTISDLNSMIRNIIYDPSRVIGAQVKNTAIVSEKQPQKNNLLTFF